MRIVFSLVLCVLANVAQAQSGPYDGHWGVGDVPECLDPTGLSSTCPALLIERGTFSGEEGQCTMRLVGVVPGFETAEVHDFDCRGEGDTWTFRALMHRDTDGRLTVLNDYGPTVYLPVTPPAPTK